MAGDLLRWDDVVKVHRSWRGVAVRDGVVKSLLCNQNKDGPYGDAVLADSIRYVMPEETLASDRKAIERMVGVGDAFPVFEKLGVNAWKAHGSWRVVAAERGEGCVVFELRRA